MWTEIGTINDCDDVGGDIQVGTAYGRRFADFERRDDRFADIKGLQALIEVHFYVAEDDKYGQDAKSGYWVGRSTTYTVCTDAKKPGDTEEWSDAYFSSLDREEHTFASKAEADRRARRLIRTFRPNSIKWNGKAFHSWSQAPDPK